MKKCKYFSIIVDSTPDNTKVDQLTIIIWGIWKIILLSLDDLNQYIKNEGMETALIKCLINLGIHFKNCIDRRQYIKYVGYLQWIKILSEHALFVPSLNFVGSNAFWSYQWRGSVFFSIYRWFIFFFFSLKI